MKTATILVALLNVENVLGFGSVPDGGANAVELARSECQDIFFGKGSRRVNPLNDGQVTPATVCSQIELNQRNVNVRIARQSSTNTAEWCNQGGRSKSPTACSFAYALVGNNYRLCEYVNGACVLGDSEPSCNEAPDVCDILTSETPISEISAVGLDSLCSQFTNKASCNAALFKITNNDPTQLQFATCAFDGTTCKGLGPHRCPATARRELEQKKAANKRDLQGGDVCSIFTDEATCNNGYTYTSGTAYSYDSYSPSNRPPALAICEWSAGRCSTARTCPYMCELAASRNVDVPGTVDTDATLTFGDRAITEFCEVDIDRRNRAAVCESFYRVERTNSPLAPREVTACRHEVGNAGPFCTREVRDGFSACI